MGMSLVSICIVLSALILVVSLIMCGFLYFSFVTISRNIVDEETYILIDSDDPGVSSIYKEILEESKREKTLSKGETSTITYENIKPCNGSMVNEDDQSLIHTRNDHFQLGTVKPTVSNNTGSEDTLSRPTLNECVKLIPLLEELPLDSHSFP